MKREGSRKYYAQTKLLISTLYEFLQVPSGNQGPGGDDDQCDFLGLRHGDHCGAGSGAPGYLHASLHQRGKCLSTEWRIVLKVDIFIHLLTKGPLYYMTFACVLLRSLGLCIMFCWFVYRTVGWYIIHSLICFIQAIRRTIDKKNVDVNLMFNDELNAVKKELTNKAKSLIPWHPKFAGQALWARQLKRRIERGMMVSDLLTVI